MYQGVGEKYRYRSTSDAATRDPQIVSPADLLDQESIVTRWAQLILYQILNLYNIREKVEICQE